MTLTRDPYVEKVMSRLRSRHETKLRGIVLPEEVRRLCGMIRELLNGREIDENEREVLTRYTQLQRCFTVAEANRIADMHGQVMMKRVKIKEKGE